VKIHGDLSQNQRDASIRRFKAGNARVLIGTDVAARGIDISGVSHVINFDIPDQIDDYVHRIGRTGRAGHKGVATALFSIKGGHKGRGNVGVAPDLIKLMGEAKQEIPQWLLEVQHKARPQSPTRGGRYNQQHGRRNRDEWRGRGRGGRGGRGIGARERGRSGNTENQYQY
jgi:ATP-dependent RNA helicase DDX3X